MPIKPPTYPARPVNGGPLPQALPKNGHWFAEPKYNGWYAHGCPAEGTLYNRHNERLTIEREFTAALQVVKNLPFDWLTYEALERRHGVGQGTLIILDYVPNARQRDETYADRRRYLETVCAVAGIAKHTQLDVVPSNSVLLVAPYAWTGAATLYQTILPRCNREAFNCEFYEGIVAKRADSKYPVQLRTAKHEFPFWMKHRWAF